MEKWEGKRYRLVIQRQKRTNGDLDLWESEYTYRCILTNDYESSTRDIVEFYNRRTKQAQSDVCISYGLQGGGKATKWINRRTKQAQSDVCISYGLQGGGKATKWINLRGGKERIFDDMNNGFGWNRLPKSFMAGEDGYIWQSSHCLYYIGLLSAH